MPTSGVTYAQIVAYLDAIAANPANSRDAANASHKLFWRVGHKEFTTGTVPNQLCNGQPIPIVHKDPAQCAFLQALKNSNGWCSKSQMPKRGPFITEPDYTVSLADGSVISGKAIIDNIEWWLTHDMPEF